MYLSENHYLINREQHQDRLREIEHQRLINLVGQQGSGSKLYRKACSKFGSMMVTWGSKLQSYAATTSYASVTQ
jgi:hypothetical protein